MTKNLLDLREKGMNKVRIVERIIFKPRSFKFEMFRMLSVVFIVTVIGFGISNADDLNPFKNGIETATENFSALGKVQEITNTKITLTEARGSDDKTKTEYSLDINYLEKVETNANTPLIITDIKIGDTVIAQGLTNGNIFFIKRIVSFGGGVELPVTEVATTTIDMASSTADTASTTDSTSTDETSTESVIEEAATTEDTSTTSDEILDESTSTLELPTSTEDEATTTSDIVETVSDVVEAIVEIVTDVIETVVEAVTGNSSSTPEVIEESLPPPAEIPEEETVEEVLETPSESPEPESIN